MPLPTGCGSWRKGCRWPGWQHLPEDWYCLLYCLSLSVIAAVVTLAAALILFAWLVIKYENTEKSRKRYLRLAEINRLELKCLEGDFSGFKPGEEYAERDHPYSYDLDIFGKASLFQYHLPYHQQAGL